MSVVETILNSDLDLDKARSYRNGFATALAAAFLVMSYQYWIIGELAIETMFILFSAAFVFMISKYLYTRD
jgi:hypothetical protein